MRYVLEGTWSGYHAGQSHVVHRTVERNDKFPPVIHYTDGTALYLSVRPALPRERVKEIHGYDSLIADCVHYRVTSVWAVIAAKATKAKTGSPAPVPPGVSSEGKEGR